MSFKRLLSFLLAIVMIFSMLPAGVMAVDGENPEVSSPESSVDPTGGTDETHPTEPSVGQYDYPLLELDVRATAEITEPGGYAYFRFTAASSCHLQFTSYAEQDTYGHLYDSEMREVSTDDDNGEMYNFAISYKVEAGETYILGVRYWDGGYVGSYEISVSHDPMWLNCRTEQQATCTQTGIEVRYCTTCDYESEPIYIPAGCQYEQTEYVSATCTTGGYAVFTCALCGNSYREEYPSNGHSYHMETVKHSSCTEEGLLRQTCVSCGYYVENVIPAMGHQYDHGTCTHCGDVINASGTCGDNITWTFSGTDCTLYLTGSGPMAEMSTDWLTYQHHIEKIVVSEGITSLASCAFSDCYYVTEVILPSTLTRIENNAFQHCSMLKRITLPSGLKYLGNRAFYNSGLETITLPAGFTSMEVVSAFDDCYNLQEILVEQGNPTFTSVDGVLYCQNGAGLVAIPGAKQMVFVLPSVTVVWASVTGHLRTMVFQGEAPNSWYGGLNGMNYLTVYYPADSTTWTPDTLMNFGRANANCMPLPELVILGQPEMQQSVKSNENFEVKVIAHGTGLTYQWQMSGRDVNWVDVPDSNSAVLTLCAADLGSYVALRCVITDENGNVVTSEQANVDIHPVVEFGSNLNELHLVNVESGRNVYLNFTPMVDGEYIFHFSHGAMDFYIQEILGGEYEQLSKDDNFLKLKLYAGNTYTVKVYSYVSTELKFWVTAPVTLELDEAFSGYFADNGDEQVFYFTAPETALYELYRSGDGIWFSVYNVQTGESCGNGTSFVTLEAGVTYRFDVIYTGWGFTSYSIQLRAIPKITLGQSADITVVPGLTGALAVYADVDMFCVITASSANGMYPSSMQINAGDDGMFEDIYESSVIYLKAGKVYTLYIYNHMSAEPLDLTVSVNKAPDPDYIWFNGRSLNTVNETWVDWQIQPSNSGRNFTWTISDPSVLEITRVERYGFYVRGLKAGTATITVTADNGTTHTATFTVTEPASLNLGESHTVTIVPGQLNSFAFTPDQPGYYVIEVSGVDNAWLSNAYNCSAVNSTWYDETFYQYVHVYDSSLCVFEISTNHYKEMAGETRTMTVTVVPCQMPTVINIPASIVMFSEMSTTIRATFASVLEFDDLNWEIEGDCVTVQEGYYTYANIYANHTGTAVLVATTSDGAVVARCEITVTDSLPLTFGQSTQVDMAANGSARLCFTPDVSGYYVIDFESSNYHMTLHDQNGNYMEVSYSNGTITAWLEAGVTYTLYLHNKYGEDRVVNVSVSGLPALEMGKEILLGNYDKTVYYTFTPTETGIYSFDTIGYGAYFMCDGERYAVISGYGNDYGVKQAVYLKAGKQYVVRFDACWRENTSTFIERVGIINLGESQVVNQEEGSVYYAVVELPHTGYYNVFASGSDYSANIFSVQSQDGMKDQTQWTGGFEMGYVTTACLEPGQYLIAMYVQKTGDALTVKVDEAPNPDSIYFYDTTITVGQSQHMSMDVYPNYAARDFVWTVSDPSVVEIEYTYANYFYIRGLSAGTATITATASNGTTRTATITVKAPIDVQLGMSQEVTIQRDNSVTLQFETQMGGYYAIAFPEDCRAYANMESGGYEAETKLIDGMRYMYFYAYDYNTCRINLYYYDMEGNGPDSVTTTVLVDACKTPTSLNMPSELTMYVNSYATLNVTFSDPWEYGDLHWNFDCYEAEISSTYRNSVTLYAREPGTGLLSVWTADGMAAAYCNVTIIDGIQLTFGQMTEFHMSDKGGIRVTFTPDVSGYYTLDFGGRRYSVDASSANDAMLMGYNGYSSYTIYLNAGVKYTFALWNYDGMDHTANVTIREPEILGLDDYRSQWMESYGWQAYQFVPETTGYYYLRVTDYQINGYIYAWDQSTPLTMYRCMDGYDYIFVKLEAGQKYLVLAEKYDSWSSVNLEISMHAADVPTEVYLSANNTVAVGSWMDMYFSFAPFSAVEDFTITCSDESVLRLDSVYYHNNYCHFEALKEGTVTVTIETASGLTSSITITVVQPNTLTLGMSSSVTVAPNGQVYFNFTVPQSGLYVIRHNTNNLYSDIIAGERRDWRDRYDDQTGEYYRYFELYEGVEYTYRIDSSSSDTEVLEILMKKAESPVSMVMPERIVGTAWLGGESISPEISSYWEDFRFYWTLVENGVELESVYDTDVLRFFHTEIEWCHVNFGDEGELTLVATSYDGSVVRSCVITVIEAQRIDVGVPNQLTISHYDDYRYSFIPEKTGMYRVDMSSGSSALSMEVRVRNEMSEYDYSYMTISGWHNYYFFEAGCEYFIEVSSRDTDVVNFTLSISEQDFVTPGETISITSGGTYLFRVEESGWYWLDVNSGYEINWYNVNAGGMGSVSYDNIGMDSIIRSVVYMEAGVTYGCCIYGMDVTGQATFTKSGLPTYIYAYADATTIVAGMGTAVWVDFAEGRYSNVTVSMSQEGIVTLTSQNGRYYYFSALAEGTVTITFTTENGLTASVTLRVVAPIELALNERFQLEMAGESQTCFKVNDAYDYNVIYVYGEAVGLSVENGYHVTSISDGQGGTYYYYELHGSSSTITLHKYEGAGAVELEVRRAEMPTSISLPERIEIEYGQQVTVQAIFGSYWEFRYVNWSWTEGCISVSTNGNQCYISTNHYGESTLTAYYYDDAGVYHGAECVIEVVAPSVTGSLTLNQFVRYDMQYAGDYPIYSFTATEDGSYFFACVADGDSRIYLYDSNWMQMRESDDYNGHHPGLWQYLSAGQTVYLKARPYSGDSMFALNVVVATHEDIYNGSQEPDDPTFTGELMLGQFSQYVMQYVGDYPYYSFTAPEDGRYFFGCVSEGDNFLAIYSPNWDVIVEQDDYSGLNAGVWLEMTADQTVYVQPRPLHEGAVLTLNVIVATHDDVYDGPQPDEPIEPEHPDIDGVLVLGQYTHNEEGCGIYLFTAPESRDYFFACVSDGDTWIEMYDMDMNLIAEADEYYGWYAGVWKYMEAGETVYIDANEAYGDPMNVIVATHDKVFDSAYKPGDNAPYISFRQVWKPYDDWCVVTVNGAKREIFTTPLDVEYVIFYINYVNDNGEWVSEPVHVNGDANCRVESLAGLGEPVEGVNSDYFYRLSTCCWDVPSEVSAEWNGQTYSMPIYVQLPDYGFYTDPIRSNESFIKEFQWDSDSDEPCVIYFILKEGAGYADEVELVDGNAELECISDRVVKITVYTDDLDEIHVSLEFRSHGRICYAGIDGHAVERRKPQIVAAWIGNWGDEWFEMDEGYWEGLSMTAYDQMFVIFYLTYVNENGERVYEPIHVSTSEHLQVQLLKDCWEGARPQPGEENFDYFYCLTSDPAFWDQVGQIMYEYNGEILAMDIPIERNFFGFYENDNICNETYLPYYEWDPDSNEHVFYFALRDEINYGKDYITSVEVLEGYAYAEVINGSLVKITVYDDAPENFWLRLHVCVTNEWGDQYWSEHGIDCRRGQSKNPYLTYEWISFEDGYAFANGFGYETMLQTLPGRDHCLIFYMNYVDENGNWVSVPVDVTAGPFLTLTKLTETDNQIMPGAMYSEYYYFLQVEADSWDQVTYISYEFNGETLTIPVEISRPHTGFYSEPEMNNDTFVDWIQLYPSLGETVIYLGRDQLDWIITDISRYNRFDGQMLPGGEYIESIEVLENGMYKITFTDDLPEGGFYLEIWVFAYNQEGDWMEDYTIGIWCDVQLGTCKHEYDITYREPTCTEWGEAVGVCVHCGETVVEEYEPLGHNVHEYHENFETINGITYCDRIVRCDRCGEETSRTYVPYAMLTFGSASGTVGSVIEVPVSISALTLASYQLTLRYGSGLKLLDIREGSKTLGGFTYNMDNGMILDYRVMNKTVEGELFILVFEVLESSDPNAYNISCDVEGFFQEDKTQLAIAVNDVFVEVHEHYDSAYDSDHACDGCGAVLSYCDDGDSDHYCDECGSQLTNHNYTSTDTAPTCTEDGYTTYTCSDCDHSYTVPIPATGHSYDGGTISVAPTCTAEGVMTYTCHCGHTKTEKITPTGHNYSSAVTAPTCMAQGYTTYTCGNCNNSYIGDVTDATGHTYDTGKVSVAPTCTTEGVKTYTCHCGHTKTEKIAATGHRYTSVVTAPTCTTRGYTTHTCACGVSYVDSYADAIGHNTTNTVYDIGKESTCLTAGVRGHYKCESCGGLFVMDNAVDPLRQVTEEALIIPAHTLTDVAEVKATCTTNGVRAHKKCEGCIKYFIDDVEVTAADLIIVATGHSYIDVVTAPTCTEQGYTNHICQNCGDSYRDTFTAAIGHSYSSEVTDPTCTTNGYTIYTCQTCGHSVVSDYTPATGHTYNSGTVTVAPGCLTDGVMIYTCHCGHERIEKIAPTGHNYTSEVIAPGCTTVGYTRNVCQSCGHTYHSNYTAAIGHAAGEIREVNARFINGALYCDVLTFCRHCGEQIDETIRLKYRLGDVNDDGDINVLDAMFVSQYVVGDIGAEKLNLEAADVNGDGEISVQDAMLIAQFIVGDIDHFEKEDLRPLGYGTWAAYLPSGENLIAPTVYFGVNDDIGSVSVMEYAPVASLDPAYVEEAIRYGAKILTWEGTDYLRYSAYGDPCYYEIDGNIVTVHLGEPGDDWGENVVLKRIGPDQLEVVSVTGFAGYYLTVGTVLTYIG